ncbi:hypothetical protein HZ994_06630 [Akkermansiaceae bacterium]|nr:hypothetical protein HZ994_06630 [Akkermansiaceae bacterium]
MIHRVRQGYIFPFHLIGFGITAALAAVLIAGARAAETAPLPLVPPGSDAVDVEPVLEAPLDNIAAEPDVELPTDDEGFYPTIDETLLLGGDYPRSRDGQLNYTPDSRMLTAQGLYPHPNPGGGYEAPWAEPLSPLNPFLGFLAPREALITEGEDWPRGLNLELDSSFPLLVRDFSPERATLKAGPTYFDLLFVGMTVLHSDYQGQQAFPNGSEDGWLMGVEFGLRGLVQFTDQFYLSLAGVLVYLPLENEVGIRLGSGGIPTVIADLKYRFESGSWDVLLYDTIYAGIGDDLFANLESGAFDRAGRYSFGFNDRRQGASGFYDGDNSYFTNAIGFDATTPAWEDWRFWLSGKHSDTWRTWGFDDRLGHNSLYSRLGYNGNDIIFSPAFEYYLDHFEYYQNNNSAVHQRFYLSLNGRITENLSAQARVGYFWQNGVGGIDDSYLYSLALLHELSRYTSHSLSAGKEYFNYELTGESTVASYIRYSLNHTFTRSLSGAAWVQYSEQDGRFFDGERTNVTGILRYALFGGDSSALVLRGAYENRHGSQNGDRWLGRLSYTQMLYSRTTAELFYQYEESTVFPSFNEQLFGLTIRQYF